MEIILDTVLPIITTLLGLIGGSVGVIYWRENKRLKQVEVNDKLTEVENKQAEAWQKLYEEQKAKSDEKSEQLRTLYAERDNLNAKLMQAMFDKQRLQWYHCTANGCKLRKPPHVFDQDGSELEAEIYRLQKQQQ